MKLNFNDRSKRLTDCFNWVLNHVLHYVTLIAKLLSTIEILSRQAAPLGLQVNERLVK